MSESTRSARVRGADAATDEQGAFARIEAADPTAPFDPTARDKAWRDAALPREGDRLNRDPDDLLSAPQRRLQALADQEHDVVLGQRDGALRTLAAISRSMATTAAGLDLHPDLTMTHAEAAKMLTDFLTIPQ